MNLQNFSKQNPVKLLVLIPDPKNTQETLEFCSKKAYKAIQKQ